jgi:hypothetical protein
LPFFERSNPLPIQSAEKKAYFIWWSHNYASFANQVQPIAGLSGGFAMQVCTIAMADPHSGQVIFARSFFCLHILKGVIRKTTWRN